jgi:hypothetical protein
LHKKDDERVVFIEYEVHGTVLTTGVKYDNRFCSVIKIESAAALGAVVASLTVSTTGIAPIVGGHYRRRRGGHWRYTRP